MELQGKGFFIWKINQCEGGDADEIAHQASKAGLSHILLKIANGIYGYNYDWSLNQDLAPPVVRALKSKGIQVWGWHYVYGDQPIQEARIAVRRVQELNLDGYVIDAESEYKDTGKKTSANHFMRELRGGLGHSVPIALSSYRYPSLHPIPWNEFLELCDYNLPQVYWLHADNPADQLSHCLREFSSARIKYQRPIIPVGPAFKEHGWEPKPEEIKAFLDTSRSLNLKAVNFWEWNACRENLNPQSQIWKLISEYKWNVANTKPKDICERYINALNTLDPKIVSDLYNDRGVHITSERTISSKANIQDWYYTFLNQILPAAKFNLTGCSGSGNSHHLNWTATSNSHHVLDGSDTIGVNEGKITYHYTRFSLTPIPFLQRTY